VFNRNNIIAGLVYGILLPLMGFVMLYQVFSLLELKGIASRAGLSENFRERTIAIIAIALNLIPMNIFKARRWDLSIRGVVIATAILALVWVIRYGVSMF
jgi:hypothetical protein